MPAAAPRRPLAFLSALLALALLAAAPAGAEEAPGPRVELDLEALLTDPRVTATSLEDPVWSVALSDGAALLQVPVRVVPGDEPGRLDRPAAGLGGARLLGWSVPAPQPAAGRAPAETVAAAPPRVARELRVEPDGSLAWEVERLGRDFAVTSSGAGSLYAFLADGDLLRARNPEPPARAPRGTDRAVVRATQDAYRADRDAYAALRDAVDALPTVIEEGPVDRVWLVYERRRPDQALVFEQAGEEAFGVEPADFKALRALAGSVGGPGGSATPSTLRPDALVRPGKGLGNRLVAIAAGQAVAAGGSGPTEEATGGVAVALAEAVTERGGAAANRALIQELSRALPPTPTTVRLIAAAAPNAGDYGRVAALRVRLLGLAKTAAGVPDLAAGQATAELQSLLERPDGPDPATLVDAFADAAADRPALVEAAAATLRPERLPAERLDALVAAVIDRAASDAAEGPDARAARRAAAAGTPAAAALLDRVLLRSFRPEVASATLGRLAEAAGGASRVDPAVRALRRSLTRSSEPDAGSDAAARRRQRRIEPGSLTLGPADHGLIQQLRSGDAGLRASAAAALRLYRLPEGRGRDAGDDATLAALLSATGEATPAGLIALLARSGDTSAVNAALLRMASRPGGAKVLPRLAGSGRGLAAAARGLEPEARVALAAAALTRGARPDAAEAAGLAAEPAAAAELGERLSAGRPVRASDLAAAIGDEAALLAAAGSDDGVLARGAMAGLAATAGADAAGQTAAIAAMTEGGATPASAWPAVRDRLRLARLERAAGAYLLVVTTGPAPAEAAGPGAPGGPGGAGFDFGTVPGEAAPAVNAATEQRRVELGVVTLRVTDTGLSMAGDPVTLTLAPDSPAIRIADPSELANFPGEEILAVPVAAAAGPLDLSENAAGWGGSCPLGAGGKLGVTLIRTDG